jgi:MoxR-like ATPase
MEESTKNRTKQLAGLIPKIVEAGLFGNRQRLELLCLNSIRTFRDDLPELADQLGSLLSRSGPNGSGATRSQPQRPPPADHDGGLALLRVHPVVSAVEPILPARVYDIITRFLNERSKAEQLLKQGFAPPKTLLLKGPPGTGKTMIAEWVAHQLGMRLIVLDLATSISSFLGKTGNNLRRSLDYARATPCVLLLDEFDAIGKRRDDPTEIGELKRIVNVLLKELEEWPIHSVLVAATNHPELLDPAIHRRFDVVAEIPLPADAESKAIIRLACGRFSESLSDNVLNTLTSVLLNRSGSDLTTIAQSAVRRHVLEGVSLERSFIETVLGQSKSGVRKKQIAGLIRHLQASDGLTVRDIAVLTGKSASTVQYHLAKESNA